MTIAAALSSHRVPNAFARMCMRRQASANLLPILYFPARALLPKTARSSRRASALPLTAAAPLRILIWTSYVPSGSATARFPTTPHTLPRFRLSAPVYPYPKQLLKMLHVFLTDIRLSLRTSVKRTRAAARSLRSKATRSPNGLHIRGFIKRSSAYLAGWIPHWHCSCACAPCRF